MPKINKNCTKITEKINKAFLKKRSSKQATHPSRPRPPPPALAARESKPLARQQLGLPDTLHHTYPDSVMSSLSTFEALCPPFSFVSFYFLSILYPLFMYISSRLGICSPRLSFLETQPLRQPCPSPLQKE